MKFRIGHVLKIYVLLSFSGVDTSTQVPAKERHVTRPGFLPVP